MHVLILSTGYPTDYVPLDGIFYRDQADALAMAGHKVGFIAVNPISAKSVLSSRKLTFGLSTFSENNVSTYLYKYLNIPKYPEYCVLRAGTKGKALIKKYISQHGVPDIVHLHCYEAVLAAKYLKDQYGIPFIVTEHSSRFLTGSVPAAMEKYAIMAFTESAHNISVSEEFALVLEKKYKKEFHYLPNIVDTEFYKPQNQVISKKGFIFLSAGILNENKNHRLLINAFSLFIRSGRSAGLVIAGEGPQHEALNGQVKKLNLKNKVEFTGLLSRKALSERMSQCNVFVLTSKHETFGVVLIEAMSCGKPVVSTRSGGPQSIVNTKELGILCDSDENSLFLAMQEVYDNFASYDPKVIRQAVLDNFSREAVASKLTSVYNKVLNKI
jgi:glycosyltransferase involved in cell wall biosynthesis